MPHVPSQTVLAEIGTICFDNPNIGKDVPISSLLPANIKKLLAHCLARQYNCEAITNINLTNIETVGQLANAVTQIVSPASSRTVLERHIIATVKNLIKIHHRPQLVTQPITTETNLAHIAEPSIVVEIINDVEALHGRISFVDETTGERQAPTTIEQIVDFIELRQQVLCQIKSFINRIDITPHCDLTKDLGIDSVDIIELALNLEEYFGTDIEPLPSHKDNHQRLAPLTVAGLIDIIVKSKITNIK